MQTAALPLVTQASTSLRFPTRLPRPSVTTMSTPPPDPRAARIRENQRRSRARKAEYIHSLETRLRTFERSGVQASLDLQLVARRVDAENRALRELLSEAGIEKDVIDVRVGIEKKTAEDGSGERQAGDHVELDLGRCCAGIVECADQAGGDEERREACCKDERAREEDMSCMAAVRVVRHVLRGLGRETHALDEQEIEALLCNGQTGECWISEPVLARALVAVLQSDRA